MRFPLYSTYDEIKTNWVKFTPYFKYGENAQPGESVLFPATKDISLSDSITYNSVQLGPIGSALNKALSQNMKDTINDYNAGVKETTDSVLSFFKLGAAKAVGNLPGMSSAQSVGTLQANKIVSPNTTNLFQGVGIRTFSFSLSLIASSKEETDEIKKIIEYLRENTYPETQGPNGILSKFPATWEIDFLYGTGSSVGTSRNTYLPKIHRSFLQSFATTYNSSANAFHVDGSPFDVSIQMGFVETKAYSKQSILNGENNSSSSTTTTPSS